MIKTPHPILTPIMSSSYLYEAFWHLLLWLLVIRMQPQPDMCSWKRWENGSRQFTRFLACIMLWIMMETPHSLHTHSRSTLYIYKVLQHLQLWLMVIRMQPQPDICSWKRCGSGSRQFTRFLDCIML